MTSGVETMTEGTSVLSDGVRWASRLAVVGVVLAALTVAISLVGVELIDPLYWVGVLLSIGGVVGAAILEPESSRVRYAGGVILTMVGVLVLGYGVESGNLLALFVGVIIFIVGVAGFVVDTRRAG